jgi:hypothetical protein
MTLAASKPGLEAAIRQAFANMKTAGEADGSSPDSNIRALAQALTAAIHDYVTSAQVDIAQVATTVPPGVAVTTAGSPTAQSGATIAPGVAQHTGFGKLV